MTTAAAKKYDRALRIAKKKEAPTKSAYDLLVVADKAGEARATYALATWYLFGTEFTKKDVRRANRMLKDAALRGVADAAYDYAVSLEKGIGVKQSEPAAFEFYTRAALLGDMRSLYEVGRMLYYGLGTNKNRKIARIWLDLAEAKGISFRDD